MATLSLGWFEAHIHHGPNIKFGWARPSAFEIREALRTPQVIYQSAKDNDTHFYVKPVGMVNKTQWYTVTFLDRLKGTVTTAYNAVTYTQKGVKIWP